jgi:hypothetical protein
LLKAGTVLGEATFAGSGSLQANVVQIQQAAATLQGLGSLQAYVASRQLIYATLTGAGSFAGDAPDVIRVASTWSGIGTFQVQLLRQTPAFCTMAGSGLLSVNADISRATSSATFTGLGAMVVSVVLRIPVAVRLDGESSLRSNVVQLHRIAARFAGAGSQSVDAVGGLNNWSGEARFAGSGSMRVQVIRKHPAVPRDDFTISEPRNDNCVSLPRLDTCKAVGRN